MLCSCSPCRGVGRLFFWLRCVHVSDCGSITNANRSCLAFHHSERLNKTAVFQSDEEGNNKTTPILDFGGKKKVSCHQPRDVYFQPPSVSITWRQLVRQNFSHSLSCYHETPVVETQRKHAQGIKQNRTETLEINAKRRNKVQRCVKPVNSIAKLTISINKMHTSISASIWRYEKNRLCLWMCCQLRGSLTFPSSFSQSK